MNNDEEARFAVTPSFVLTHSSDSYSCMDNMKTVINKHNMKITSADNNANTFTGEQCNCRKKDQCPLDNKCLTSSVIYNAQLSYN